MAAVEREQATGPRDGTVMEESQSLTAMPVLPGNELMGDDNRPEKHQIHSPPEIPDSEVTDIVDSCYPNSILFISTRTGTETCSDWEQADSLEERNRKVTQFLSNAAALKELIVVNLIDTIYQRDGCIEPQINGGLVTEAELCEPFDQLVDDKSLKVSVIYLRCATDSQAVTRVGDAERHRVAGCRERATKRAFLCACEFFSIDLDDVGVNLNELRQAFNELNAVDKKLSGDEMQRQVVSRCTGARFSQMSVFPCAAGSDLQSDDSLNEQDAPEIPDPSAGDDSAINRLQQLCEKSSDEIGQSSVNVGVPIIVGKYPKGQDRDGYLVDQKNFEEIVKNLGCSENVHTLCPDDGHVTHHDVKGHIEKVKNFYTEKAIPVRCLFLLVSAHGNEAGIKTSDGDFVSLQWILLQLEHLNCYVVVFYHACRGELHHRVWLDDQSCRFASGLSFVSPDVAGCVLPPRMPRTAAIFGSAVGYAAYRNTQLGSWMPRALLDVVKIKRIVGIRRLFELVQARLNEEYFPNSLHKSFKSYIQTQFSINAGCQDVMIETGLGQD